MKFRCDMVYMVNGLYVSGKKLFTIFSYIGARFCSLLNESYHRSAMDFVLHKIMDRESALKISYQVR